MSKQLQSIQERFEAFHAANPHVYDSLVAKAGAEVAAGGLNGYVREFLKRKLA